MLFTTVPASASVTQLWNGTQAEHSCVLTSSGGVKCWGYNGYGQLGDGTTSDRYTPVDVKDSAGTGLLSGVTAVALGVYHSCALLTSGAVKCWGYNGYGQLGDNTSTDRGIPGDVKDTTGTSTLTGVTAITAGYRYTCALLTTTEVNCWGANQFGQIGDNNSAIYPGDNSPSIYYRYLPVNVKDSTGTGLLTGVTAIAAGIWHTCAVISGGVKCWGNNPYGQLGDGTVTQRYLPVDVLNSAGTVPLTGVTAISAGDYYTCALLTSGGVKCWGNNPYGQLGDGTVTQRLLPVDVLNSTGTVPLTGVTTIAAALGHTCALLTGGGVKCWGINGYGQLGDNTSTNQLLPVDTKDLAGTGLLSNVMILAAGYNHSCVLLGSGGGTSETSRVYCWGYNANGRLGDNTATNRLIPVIVNDTAPTATNVTLSLNPSGTPIWNLGETLRGNYTYTDADGEVEGSSLFKWYRATDATCTTAKTVIPGATSSTYTANQQ
jgi:alpha-tubulin suppressor-like RCC1 family protein